jgi:hypothetical protein
MMRHRHVGPILKGSGQASLHQPDGCAIAEVSHSAALDERLQHQKKIFEEDEEEDDETDIRRVTNRERQRLLRWYHDPLRCEALEQERLYLQAYITALGQIAVDSKFEAFQDRLNHVVADGRRLIICTQYLDALDFIRFEIDWPRAMGTNLPALQAVAAKYGMPPQADGVWWRRPK